MEPTSYCTSKQIGPYNMWPFMITNAYFVLSFVDIFCMGIEQITLETRKLTKHFWSLGGLIFTFLRNVQHQQVLFVLKMGRILEKLTGYFTNILKLWNFPSGIIICEWIPAFYNGKA